METVWEFSTANLRIALEIEPETIDPADSFEFEDDIAAVRNGDVEWFCARVVVYDTDGCELARDVLGGCAYHTVAEFYQAHRDANPDNRNTLAQKARNVCIGHYFPDMVRQACDAARNALAARKARYADLRLRETVAGHA